MHIEFKGVDFREPALLLTCFPTAAQFSTVSRQRHRRLASLGMFTAAFAPDMPAEPAPGVLGVQVDSTDPLVEERCVIVVSPNFAGAVLAHKIGDPHAIPGCSMTQFLPMIAGSSSMPHAPCWPGSTREARGCRVYERVNSAGGPQRTSPAELAHVAATPITRSSLRGEQLEEQWECT